MKATDTIKILSISLLRILKWMKIFEYLFGSYSSSYSDILEYANQKSNIHCHSERKLELMFLGFPPDDILVYTFDVLVFCDWKYYFLSAILSTCYLFVLVDNIASCPSQAVGRRVWSTLSDDLMQLCSLTAWLAGATVRLHILGYF